MSDENWYADYQQQKDNLYNAALEMQRLEKSPPAGFSTTKATTLAFDVDKEQIVINTTLDAYVYINDNGAVLTVKEQVIFDSPQPASE